MTASKDQMSGEERSSSTTHQQAQASAGHGLAQTRSATIHPDTTHHGKKVARSITINRSPDEIYRFWKEAPDLSMIMKEVIKMERLSETQTRWTLHPEYGPDLTFATEIIEDRPGEMISWRTVGDSFIQHAGSIWFHRAPANLGTEVRFQAGYTTSLTRIPEALASFFNKPIELQIAGDLRRLKALMETGEVPTIEGQSSGRAADENKQHTH